jgi:hypothetical protein
MADLSRRTFLRRASVGVVAGAVAGPALAAEPASARAARDSSRAFQEEEAPGSPVVAYVRKGSRGEVSIMVGEREIRHRDPALARAILRAAR